MADAEQDFLDAGAEIIWVLERDKFFADGTAKLCRDTMDALGSTQGWCVGDAQTEPVPFTFDDSPFSVGRGFDIIVPRQTMEVAYTTSHGTPSGNDNADAAEVLQAVRDVIDGLDD